MSQPLLKQFNILLAGYSYLKSCTMGTTAAAGLPPSVGVELTNRCNLKCPECPSGSCLMLRERGFMSSGLFNKIVKELGPWLWNMNLYFQGEPMLHPLFFSFLSESRDIPLTIATNGHFLSAGNAAKIVESGVKKLIVSLDGTDQATYSAYRRDGSLETVKEGIRNVAEAKKRSRSAIIIEMQFLVNRLNEHQIAGAKELARSLNVSLKLKSMQVLKGNNIGSWLPSIRKFSRYQIKNGEYVIKSSLPDRCARLWFNPVITWDGKVIPCCFDKDAEYVMGDMNTESFREIWDGTKYRIFRKSILSGRHMIEICRNCTSGLKGVKY